MKVCGACAADEGLLRIIVAYNQVIFLGSRPAAATGVVCSVSAIVQPITVALYAAITFGLA
jgi:hypothetical protein